VATINRMLKDIGLFCKRALQKRPVFCKETCIFKHPTNRSHPIHDQRRHVIIHFKQDISGIRTHSWEMHDNKRCVVIRWRCSIKSDT